MSTPGMQLISRIVREGQVAFAEVNRWGISLTDFKSLETQVHWQHILGVNHAFGSNGSVPGVNSFKDAFPSFALCDDASMSTELLCQQLRRERLTHDIKEIAAQIVEEADIDPIVAAAKLQKEANRLLEVGAQRSTDVLFAPMFGEILHDYSQIQQGIITARATWPWPAFNEATGGLQEDDYVVLYGRPKSMKSWVLCYFLAHLFNTDKKVLFYTKEMTPKNMYKRIASCLANVPYHEFRRARLSPGDYSSLLDAYEFVQSRLQYLVCLSGRDAPAGGDTVQWFRSKVEYYKPDVAAIDGLYLMSASGGPRQKDDQRVMSISRDISQMRLDLQVPIIATMQANRKAAGHSEASLDEIAYSDAIGQDATVAVRVINEKGKPTIALVVGGSREFELNGVRIGGFPSVDFTEKEVLTAKDINKAKENDIGEVDTVDEHTKPRRSPRTRDDVQKNIDQALNGFGM